MCPVIPCISLAAKAVAIVNSCVGCFAQPLNVEISGEQCDMY